MTLLHGAHGGTWGEEAKGGYQTRCTALLRGLIWWADQEPAGHPASVNAFTSGLPVQKVKDPASRLDG